MLKRYPGDEDLNDLASRLISSLSPSNSYQEQLQGALFVPNLLDLYEENREAVFDTISEEIQPSLEGRSHSVPSRIASRFSIHLHLGYATGSDIPHAQVLALANSLLVLRSEEVSETVRSL